MGTHPIFESDFDCLTERRIRKNIFFENENFSTMWQYLFLLAKSGAWYLFLISLSSLLPAVLGSEFGFRRLYIKLLVDLFDWATDRIVEDNNEEGELEDNHNHSLEKAADRSRVSVGSLPRNNSFDMRIIEKQTSVQSMKEQNCRIRTESTMEKPEHIQIAEDAMFFMSSGVEAIIDDEVTQCFRPEQLSGWNLLARTTSRYQFLSIKLTAIWFIGVLFRWCVLMPWRVSVCLLGIMWMLISLFVAEFMKNKKQDSKPHTGQMWSLIEFSPVPLEQLSTITIVRICRKRDQSVLQIIPQLLILLR